MGDYDCMINAAKAAQASFGLSEFSDCYPVVDHRIPPTSPETILKDATDELIEENRTLRREVKELRKEVGQLRLRHQVMMHLLHCGMDVDCADAKAGDSIAHCLVVTNSSKREAVMDNVQVDCVDGLRYRALVELAREHGWEGSALNVVLNYQWLLIKPNGIYGNEKEKECEVISLKDAINLIKKGPSKPDITIKPALKEAVEPKTASKGRVVITIPASNAEEALKKLGLEESQTLAIDLSRVRIQLWTRGKEEEGGDVSRIEGDVELLFTMGELDAKVQAMAARFNQRAEILRKVYKLLCPHESP